MKKYLPYILGALFGILLPVIVAAGPLPPVVCGSGDFSPVGCTTNVDTTNSIVLNNIPVLASYMVGIAGGGAVLFIVWAGFQMVTALGNDSKVAEQRWAVIYTLIGLAVVIVAQRVVSYVGTENYGQGDPQNLVPNVLQNGVRLLLGIFNVGFVIAILVGGVRMVYAQGKSDEFNTGRQMVFWAIVGAAIANLANALVHGLALYFGV